ncbi:unnamed protein product [Urochloa humidicola]
MPPDSWQAPRPSVRQGRPALSEGMAYCGGVEMQLVRWRRAGTLRGAGGQCWGRRGGACGRRGQRTHDAGTDGRRGEQTHGTGDRRGEHSRRPARRAEQTALPPIRTPPALVGPHAAATPAAAAVPQAPRHNSVCHVIPRARTSEQV